MKRLFLLLLVCTQLPGHAKDDSPLEVDCILADTIAPLATLDLKRAYVSKDDNMLVGEFELVNYDVAKGLAVPLVREPDRPGFINASAVLEFKNLNGEWGKLLQGRLIPSQLEESDIVKVVRPGERLKFRHTLFHREVLKYAGTEFQLKLYTRSLTHCIMSFPFKAVPVPAPATGLRAVPHATPMTRKKP